MIDVVEGKAIDNPALVIKDGRIVAVGRAADMPVPEGAIRLEIFLLWAV